ncbi:MAG: hypothetical protein WCV93_03270 [Candidatus Shapirobacteria bacterium]|jgi:hypothetical protein
MLWLILLTFFCHPVVFAQNIPSPLVTQDLGSTIQEPIPTPTPNILLQYQTDYLYQRDLYQQAYLTYINKRQVHTKYQSLTTQKDKLEATKNALLARNNLLKSYLLALRVSLDPYKTQNPTETEKNQIEISKWETYFDEQNSIVSALNNEADISRWANDFKTKYISIQQVIYAALVRQEVNQKSSIIADIETLATTIQSNPNLKPEGQNWFSNLPIKIDLVKTATNDAFNQSQRQQNQNNFINFYPSAKVELNKATGYLTEINDNLKSIVIKFWQK